MAKPELSLIEERDETQRALGCVGLSAFAHVGLLIAILLAPSFKESAGVATGTTAGIELSGESIADAAPAGLPQASADSSAPVEVLLADANDPNAVALPNTPATEEPAVKTADIAPVETQTVAKKSAVTKAKPAVESADIASALTQARKEAVKAPAKSAKAAAVKMAPAPTEVAAKVETSDTGDVATLAQSNEAQPIADEQDAQAKNEALTAADAQADDDAAEAQTSAETQTAQTESKAAQEDEAVPLQVALPESESLTQAQANALQAPGANTNEIPADAKPIETVQSVRSNSAPTGMIVTRPANAAPMVAANTPASATTGTLGGTGTTAGAARGLPGNLGANGTVSGTTQSRGGTAGIGVPFGAQVRDARTLQAMPGNPLPTYPLPDRIANREGTTVLIGRVRNDGHIENVTLEKSSGSRLMDESAAKAFSQWKYRPGQEGYVRLPMQFKLVGDARVIPAQLNRQ